MSLYGAAERYWDGVPEGPLHVDVLKEFVDTHVFSDTEKEAGVRDFLERGDVLHAAQFASVFRCVSLGSELADLLVEDQSHVERVYTMLAVGDLEYAPAYDRVEAFLDTEYERQALIVLAQLDLDRTMPLLAERADKCVGPWLTEISARVIETQGYGGFRAYIKQFSEKGKQLLGERIEFYNALTRNVLSEVEVLALKGLCGVE